jgi:hypothetical protein
MSSTIMTPKKLHTVDETRGRLFMALKALEDLHDAEPVSQPPSLRAVELRHLASKVYDVIRTLEVLWS